MRRRKPTQSLRKAVSIELVEPRVLLASTISGLVNNDYNLNGNLDTNDNVIIGQTVYIDTNNSGSLDSGEPSTTTNANGGYSFNVDAGTYTIRTNFPSGFVTTKPTGGDGSHVVTVDGSTFYGGYNFTGGAPAATGAIAGYIYRDQDQNGVPSPGDLVERAGMVFLDLNNNGVRDLGVDSTANVDANGSFSFGGLSAGTYVVRFSPYSGYRPLTQVYTVDVAATGPGVNGVAFAVQKTTSGIYGQFFNDANQNGTRESGEASVLGGAVYIDLNNDGIRQETEPLAQNNDATYMIPGPLTYPFTLRPLGGSAYTPTMSSYVVQPSPAANGPSIGMVPVNSSGFVSGNVFRDNNANGIKDSGEAGVSGVKVYLDADNDGTVDTGEAFATTNSSGDYTIQAAAGSYVLRQVLQSLWYQTTPTNNAGINVTIPTTGGVTGKNFGTVPPAMIYGVMYDDLNANGSQETGEPVLPGYLVYLDTNNNGTYDNGERSTPVDSSGNYYLNLLPPGTYNVKQIVPSGYRQVTPATAGYTITPNGQNVQANFGNTRANLGGTISGTVFNDANFNGVFDTGDGVLGGSPHPNVWEDTDNDGQIDSNEQSAVADSNGKYVLHDLPAGTYNIKALVGSNYTQTSPGTGGYTVTLAANQSVTRDFGVRLSTQVPQELIIDNTTPNYFAATGAWVVGSGVSGYYGSNFLYDNNKNKGSLTAQWLGNLTPATYEVFARWTSSSSRSTKVPYDIKHNGVTTTVYVNQQKNGGTWVSLGKYAFGNDAQAALVTLRNAGTSGVVVADAIRFVPSTSTPPTDTRNPIRVNAGGKAFTTGAGSAFDADRGYSGGSVLTDSYDVLGTTDDTLYLTRRYGSSFSYNLAATDGTYQLKLYFADVSSTKVGQRKFDVTAEGTKILSSYDIFAEAGAKKAVTKTFNVTVVGGQLNLSFKAITGNAVVCGIELIPV